MSGEGPPDVTAVEHRGAARPRLAAPARLRGRNQRADVTCERAVSDGELVTPMLAVQTARTTLAHVCPWRPRRFGGLTFGDALVNLGELG